MDDRYLTEVQRQRKYLDKLPKNFTFPLFNARQALLSQRASGYRHTAAAARELIDNALEAKATRIDVAFDRPKELKAHQRADTISSVAFIDNGAGMLPEMARYALSWGAGTHFDDPSFIGRFGFGLPNASINQTEIVEVYTKTVDAKAITKAWLDINEMGEFEIQSIPEPREEALPDFVRRHLDRQGLRFDHGTVVVWRQPDRLSYRTGAAMREHLVDDFGVTYRYLLDRFELYVENTKVGPVDPLFLDDRSRYFVPAEKGGAILSFEATFAVKYFKDKETGAAHLRLVEEAAELNPNDVDLLATGGIHVRVARFPKDFAVDPGRKGKIETDAHRRFEIRKSKRGMSFVRSQREIDTIDVFPKSIKDKAKGLGRWPLLQSYAYHWGIEVRFEPALDPVFGITNDKQTVRPIEDLWRVFVQKDLDAIARAENAWQVKQRAKPLPQPGPGEARAAETAAAGADIVSGEKPRIPEHEKNRAGEAFERAAGERAAKLKISIDEAREALREDAQRRPYGVGYFDDTYAPFYRPVWSEGSRLVAEINRAHPFYTMFYGQLDNVKDMRAKQAIDLLLIALTRAELTVDQEVTRDWYEAQRSRFWSPFLNDALKILDRALRPDGEDDSDAESGSAAA
jgi:hypothetical protein